MKVITFLEKRSILLKGKIISQEGGFINVLKTFITTVLPLMKNVLTPLAKSDLISLGLTTWASAADAAIQKKKKKTNLDQAQQH